MANQLYKQFGKNQNNMSQLIGNIKQFQKGIKDPQSQLQSMLKSGQVPQNILNQAQQMARPIYEMMKGL